MRLRTLCSALMCSIVVLWLPSLIASQDGRAGAYPPLQIGDVSAPVGIEVFIDLQCGAATAYLRKLKEFQKQRPDELVITVRSFPISRHKNAAPAARAVEAAASQGKWLEMIELIGDGVESWKEHEQPVEVFASYATKLGMDVKLFELEFDGAVVGHRIQMDMERARLLGVNGTPYILVNGYPTSYWDAQDLAAIILKTK